MRRLLCHIPRPARLGTDLLTGALAVLCALAAFVRPSFNLQPGRSAGRACGQPTRRPEPMECFRGLGRALYLLSLLLLVPHNSWSATPPGTPIPNFATLGYTVGGVLQPALDSNIVRVNVRSPATIEFLAYAPTLPGAEPVPVPVTAYQNGGSFTPIPAPPETAGQPMPLTPADLFHAGNPFYLRLTDLDQNVDPATVQAVLITVVCVETGDIEVLRLTETGPDTGVFTGYLSSAGSGAATADGVLIVTPDCHIEATYTDAFDGTDSAVDAALVDPYGYVFDSATGNPVDGATVTLIDLATGLPATTIVGDNGAPGFPASIVTGSTFDFGGITYGNPEGGFRFPFVPPGSYRLVVYQLDGYAVPSTVSDADLLSRSWWGGSGYVLANGSRGDSFTINPGPAIRIDIPVDPLTSYLWLQKDVSRDTAATGDFLKYTLLLENGNSASAASGVTITDRLPLGFRYQEGSTRLAGRKVGDPAISPDGRTLAFTVGHVPPAGSIEVTYVVEVAAGAKAGKAVNSARAVDANNISSNTAQATVMVQDEFFRNKAFLIGRVLTGSCSQDDTAMQGLPGVRLYLEDGTYVVTDKDGNYHFEGVDPGVHVVQVDTTTLPSGFEMIPCELTTQFAGRNFSQFVDLRGGTLWRVNFYAAPLPPPTGEVTLQLFSTLGGDKATLRATVQVSTVPVDNLRLTMMLPGSSEYLPGSATLNGGKIEDPDVMGGALTLRAPHLDAKQSLEFTIQVRLAGGDTDRELPAKALLTFDSPTAQNQRTPLAENRFRVSAGSSRPGEEIRLYPRFPSFVADLQESDRVMLEDLAARLHGQQIARIDIVGHTDNQEIAPHARNVFADNQALSEGRSQSVATFLRSRLQVPATVITVRGMGETMPVADNATEAGRTLNRRVELYLVTAPSGTPPRAELTLPNSSPQSTTTTGVSATVPESEPARKLPTMPEKAPEITPQWLASLKAETALTWPPVDWSPEAPVTRIVVQHPRASKVDLSVNGIPVAPFHLEASKPLPNTQFLVSNWENVGLAKGRNLIEATITLSDGQPAIKLERVLWFVSVPERIEWSEEQSTLLADGIHPPTFALRLTDRDGRPLHPGQEVEFRVSTPYLALRDGRHEDTVSSAGVGRLVTGIDGLAYIQLEPTAVVGEVKLELTTEGDPLEITAWLKPAPRDWILVGFAEGTVGHTTIKDNQVSAAEAGIDDHEYTDGQVKFFAKGAIKGEWLLTLAYDSDKPDLDGESLRQIIDPDTYYPLYGDETSQGYEASSAENLYVKLERDQFYALFGDMETGLTQTTLSQYSRSLNGFKSELQSEHFAYTVFAADTRQAFKKDEIRGDGTAGRYTLSQSELVINSEEVVIETRDRFHNEQIVKEERLARHVDYDIDYDAGTLYFKRPVPSKDENFNPVFIVVRYETLKSSKKNWNYGGRAALRLLDQKLEIGGSLIHEENGADEGDLYGTDVTVKLTPQTTVRAEAATSDVESIDDEFDRQGDAYLAEIEHLGEKFDLRAWFRQQDSDFGLGQQNGGTEGIRTYGAQGAYRFNPQWSLIGEAYHEDNLDSDAKRDVASLQGEYRAERYSLSAGIREARDKFDDGGKETSRQMLLGGSWMTPDRKLTLRTNHEQSLGSENDNSDYPTRTMIGADYQLTRSVSLFAEQEFTWGEEEDTEGTRVGLKATPWQGGEIRTAVERETFENSERVFALFGVGQTWQVTREWSVDLAVDRSYTIKEKATGERVNPDVPKTSGGDDDFTAVSVGAAYRAVNWSWWNRLETRQGDSEDKVGISTGLVGEVQKGTAISARLMAFITDSADGSKRDEEEITLGMAYRPDRSKWIILEKLEASLYNESGNGADSDGMRIINHLHANYRTADRKWQTSFYYGLKYVRENFDGDTYDGYTDMLAVESRYNITQRWDVGVHGAVLHSWNSNQFDYNLGADIGCMVMTNAWVSAGYNLVGFEDEDFDDASYTAEGPYVRFRMKFDQQSVKEAAEWLAK